MSNVQPHEHKWRVVALWPNHQAPLDVACECGATGIARNHLTGLMIEVDTEVPE